MNYPIEQIKQWAKDGQAISPHVALELIQENLLLKDAISNAIDLLTDDPILLRRIDMGSLEKWKQHAQELLAGERM